MILMGFGEEVNGKLNPGLTKLNAKCRRMKNKDLPQQAGTSPA
jgi:hypothetical protein